MSDDEADSGDTPDLMQPKQSHLIESGNSYKSAKNLIHYLFPKRVTTNLKLDAYDAVAIVLFTLIGMITRVFRIQYPIVPVYEEERFGRITNCYLRGIYFNDAHPPLAKMIMTVISYYAGYRGEYNYDKIKTAIHYPSMIYVALRLTPAFFGALCVPFSYLILRTLESSHIAATIAALMVASDVVLIVESRHIFADGILFFFVMLSIFSIFLYERIDSLFIFIFEGICLGCIVSCKYTAGGIVVLALIRQIQLQQNKNYSGIFRCLIMLVIVSLVHFIFFSIHLTLLPYYPEDPIPVPYAVNISLVDRLEPDWISRSKAPSMLRRVISLEIFMLHNHMKQTNYREYASSWWSWPLALGKWVMIWENKDSHVIAMPNVLLWYPVFIGILIIATRLVLFRSYTNEISSMFYGYIFSFLPFVFVSNNTYIYHYAIPLIFGIFGLVLFIDRELNPFYKGFCLCLVGFMAVLGYFMWAPFAYGLTTPDFSFLIWTNRWNSTLA